MTTLPYPDAHGGEEAWWDDEEDADFWDAAYAPAGVRPPFNPLIAVALALLAFGLFVFFLPRGTAGSPTTVQHQPTPAVPIPVSPGNELSVGPALTLAADALIAPYDVEYWVTQGPHGQSYGHLAIDIAAGKGAAILAPIAGTVTANFTDGVGNTVLVIENDFYEVTLLHGIYSAQVGQEVAHGEPVGEESNIGYTTDMQGRLCTNRDCGYHTHLNVYDKLQGQNVNPLQLIEAATGE